MRVALLALAHAARRVVAVPVAPSDVALSLSGRCDEICVWPHLNPFGSVGTFYDDFRQIEDDEVIALLHQASDTSPCRP